MEKNRMLIDATHPEETRVVAVRNGRVEDFDFESAARKLLRGNIYLAKVTRVEPSLQAAFVDYGGNRHGFLAFSEIHPDYYQIPVADREALKQEEAAAEAAEEAEAEERSRARSPRRRRRGRGERDRPGMGAQPSLADQENDRNASDDRDQPDMPSRGFADDAEPARDDVQTDYDRSPAQALGHDIDRGDVLHAEPTEPETGDDGGDAVARTPDDRPDVDADQPVGTTALAVQDEPEATAPVEAREQPIEDIAASTDVAAPGPDTEDSGETVDIDEDSSDDQDDDDTDADHADHDDDDEADSGGRRARPAARDRAADDDQIEEVTSEEDALEEVPERPRRRARQYKIQEVIKRRQIMLVQVVKEERGNKGAALTTYISLAGRYTVLMPNTGRGGGISRKITQPQDRRRLKAIADELDVPEGMGLIIRTAGAARTKQEIKRDYEYLLRLWESVREVTLGSTAPCLVYEEGNIIKRAIRDLYSKEFDQIVVAGDAAHREAQDFMEMLMPGSGGHVASYREPEPLFARHGIERQLNALFSPYVTLRSGGYIVINQTEALVSVDVNSGKATREFSIEETALNTNLEAAEEIARQLKLRDLAGLIVVDFIDMEEKRNNRAVERRLKDALRHDRARIQVGRISHFGLLEMSRQRLRAGVLEGSTSQCPHCQGTGIIRSIESVALAVLRGLEDHLLKQATSLVASTTAEVALYILNHKRAFINEMERRYGVTVHVESSDRMHGANFAIERFAAPAQQAKASNAAVSMEWGFDREADEAADARDAAAGEDHEAPAQGSSSDDERSGRRRRRRRGRRGREGGEAGPHEAGVNGAEAYPDDEEAAETEVAEEHRADAETDDDRGEGAEGERRRRGRRRGRRGGRARRRDGTDLAMAEQPSLDDPDRHEWGVAEIARPGSDQPELDRVTNDDSGDLSPRESIVETVGGRGGRRRGGGFSPADEAVRLAVTTAGGIVEERGRSQPRRRRSQGQREDVAQATIKPPIPAPIRVRPAAGAAPPEPQVTAQPVAIVAPPVPAPVRVRQTVSVPAIASEPPETPAEVGDKMLTNGNGASAAHDEPHDEAPPPMPAPQEIAAAVEAEHDETPRPRRRGWWQRRFGGQD